MTTPVLITAAIAAGAFALRYAGRAGGYHRFLTLSSRSFWWRDRLDGAGLDTEGLGGQSMRATCVSLLLFALSLSFAVIAGFYLGAAT